MSSFTDGLTEQKAKQLLAQLIIALDELDQDDALGTEGWRHSLGFEGKIP